MNATLLQISNTIINSMQEKDVWQLHGPRVTVATMAPSPLSFDSSPGFEMEGDSIADLFEANWELQAGDRDCP